MHFRHLHLYILKLFRVQSANLCDGFHLLAGSNVDKRQQGRNHHTTQQEETVEAMERTAT